MNAVTIDSLKAVIPKSLRSNVDQRMVDFVNGVSKDAQLAESYRNNVLTYISVIKDGRFKLQDYLKAIEYVTYKLMGDTNKEAYIKTFPDRYQRMIDGKYEEKKIHGRISAYNSGYLVSKILERTIIPPSVSYRDAFHQAMMKEIDLMHNARSETVQEKAARTILEMTKPSEEANVTIDMNIKESEDIVEQYNKALDLASMKMLDMIQKGANVKDVANIKLSVKEDIIDV